LIGTLYNSEEEEREFVRVLMSGCRYVRNSGIAQHREFKSSRVQERERQGHQYTQTDRHTTRQKFGNEKEHSIHRWLVRVQERHRLGHVMKQFDLVHKWKAHGPVVSERAALYSGEIVPQREKVSVTRVRDRKVREFQRDNLREFTSSREFQRVQELERAQELKS
jgi:hypothetical protein